ncbi:MAG: hypothetical protein JWR75_776 [Devosia sp.]|nr:hypothetical protein [Devosia sp.]
MTGGVGSGAIEGVAPGSVIACGAGTVVVISADVDAAIGSWDGVDAAGMETPAAGVGAGVAGADWVEAAIDCGAVDSRLPISATPGVGGSATVCGTDVRTVADGTGLLGAAGV